MLSMMLFNSGTFFRGTHKNKRRVDLLYNYADMGDGPLSCLHCRRCLSSLRSYTDCFLFLLITFCFVYIFVKIALHRNILNFDSSYFCFSFLPLLSLLKGLHVKDESAFGSLKMCLFL